MKFWPSWILILPVLLLATLYANAQQPPLPPVPDRPAPPIIMPPCDQADPCPDPGRPWMRGTIEIQCTMPEKLDEKRAESPTRNIVPCGMCQHKCNALDDHAEETGGKSWDPKCSARCSPKGCSCKDPCST